MKSYKQWLRSSNCGRLAIHTYKIHVAALIVLILQLFLGPLFMFPPILLRTCRKRPA